MPAVSVIMNCHNGARYLAEAIDSVYAQTFEDFEIIFYDNASTDHSIQVASGYDARMNIFRHEGPLKTLGAARNEAMRHARGDWIAFLDTDDVWLPHKLSSQVEQLNCADYVMGYGGLENIDAKGEHLRYNLPLHSSGFIFKDLLRQFEANLPTSIVNRRFMVEKGIVFDETMQASEDYNLFLRLASSGDVLVSNEVLAKYRVYAASLTFLKMNRWSIERRQTLELIRESCPALAQESESQFAEAFARAEYYEACSSMNVGSARQARSALLRASRSVGGVYSLLYLLAFFPKLWALAHSPIIRARMVGFLRPLLRR